MFAKFRAGLYTRQLYSSLCQMPSVSCASVRLLLEVRLSSYENPELESAVHRPFATKRVDKEAAYEFVEDQKAKVQSEGRQFLKSASGKATPDIAEYSRFIIDLDLLAIDTLLITCNPSMSRPSWNRAHAIWQAMKDSTSDMSDAIFQLTEIENGLAELLGESYTGVTQFVDQFEADEDVINRCSWAPRF